MNRGRKFLASILTILLIVQIVPASLVTFALEAKMEQKNTDVVEHITTVPVGYTGIYTKDDLDNVRKNLSGKYIMMNDIEFSESDFAKGGAFYNGGQGWDPIGSIYGYIFTGIFDGNGYTVKNLNINITAEETVYVGLFGYNVGTIKNLGMVGGSVNTTVTFSFSSSAYAYVGGIVGSNSGTISSCYNTGSIGTSTINNSSSDVYVDTYVGGIVGYNIGTILGCYNTGSVSDASTSTSTSTSVSPEIRSYAGGIAGYGNSGTITDCYNTGRVSETLTPSQACFLYSYVGGIVAYNNRGAITNCYNTGNLSVSSINTNTSSSGGHSTSVGGIVGCNASGTITNCYNTGSVGKISSSSYMYIGGIAGTNSGTISCCYNTGSVSGSSSSPYVKAGGITGHNGGTISNCYNTGSVNESSSSGGYAYAGGIAGYNGYRTITNCYNVGSVTSSAFAGGIVGGNEEKIAVTITNCYYLDVMSKGFGQGTDTTTKLTLDQMKQQISFVEFDFETVWQISAETTYLLPTLKSTFHIEKEENTTDFAGGNGTTYNPFKISTKEQLNNVNNNLNYSFILINDIEFTESDFAEEGAFYNNGQGWVPIGINDKNAFMGIFDGNGYVVKKLYINIISESTVYAGLFGCTLGSIKNIGMLDGSVSESSSSGGDTYVGGIAGYNRGTITNCYNTSNVKSSHFAGGIVGYNNRGTITNCYNTSSVNSSYSAGGIVGYNGYGIITNCYNTGNISATSTSSVTYAGGVAGYNIYWAKITNCYNTGSVSVTSTTTHAGGIVGYNEISEITNCYNTGSVQTFTSYGSAHVGGIEGYSDSGTITNCYNIGNVSESLCASKVYVGGIAGYKCSSGTITDCYNTGSLSAFSSVSSDVYAGGISGYNSSPNSMSSCYNAGNVNAFSPSSAYAGGIVGENAMSGTISNFYNTGSVSASSNWISYAGGIAGSNGYGSITNCYNTGNVNASSSSYEGALVGRNYNHGFISNGYYLEGSSKGADAPGANGQKLTLDQMMQQSSFVGFDFNTNWEMHPNCPPNLKMLGINALQSVNFVNKSVEIGSNGKYKTEINWNPANITFIIIEYTSQNPLVATVDSNGVITGKSIGTTNIIARDVITGKTAICTVTIVQGITNISITGSNKVDIGDKTQLTATVLPNDTVNKTLKWSSSDTRIATVDQNGLVTGVGVGTVTITATATDGTNIKGTYSVKVIKHAEYIELDKTEIGLKNGEAQKLTATIYPVDTSNQKVVWTSSDNSVATVDSNGNVTAKGRGVATITVKTNDGGYEATCTVTVTQPVVSVSLNKTDLLLGTNKTYQLIATINPSNANNQNVRWESGDTTIATVDKNGFVYGVAEGTTTITVITEDGNKVAVCIVTVSSKEPDPIKLGDLTGDGIVDAADAILILRADAGLIILTEEQKIAADVTKDGIIDSADAIKIARYDAQLITEL